MGSLKSPCTTSYRSSIDTIALNCLAVEKIAFLHFGVKIQDDGSCHIAGCNNSSAILKIVFRHILVYLFLVFKNVVWALTSGGFCIVFDTLVKYLNK